LPLLLVSAHLWRFGARIVCAERFPPPGHRVVRDTIVQHGRSAVVRGRVLMALALVLVGAGGLLGLSLWRLAGMLPPP
jgi:hypothetical protein